MLYIVRCALETFIALVVFVCVYALPGFWLLFPLFAVNEGSHTVYCLRCQFNDKKIAGHMNNNNKKRNLYGLWIRWHGCFVAKETSYFRFALIFFFFPIQYSIGLHTPNSIIHIPQYARISPSIFSFQFSFSLCLLCCRVIE